MVVDSSGASIDLLYLDKQADILEGCLHMSIQRCAVRIKVAPDWKSEARGQYFPCTANKEGMCTGIIQYSATIITTPDAASFRHELIHLVTQIAEHDHPVFKKCDGR